MAQGAICAARPVVFVEAGNQEPGTGLSSDLFFERVTELHRSVLEQSFSFFLRKISNIGVRKGVTHYQFAFFLRGRVKNVGHGIAHSGDERTARTQHAEALSPY